VARGLAKLGSDEQGETVELIDEPEPTRDAADTPITTKAGVKLNPGAAWPFPTGTPACVHRPRR